MSDNNNTATLHINNQNIQLPILEDNVGNIALDIKNLRKDTGIITYDPGYSNTASCTSSICRVAGEKGTLSYRGYRIEDLVANCDFIEVAYLLVKGELPNLKERKNYMELLNRHSLLHVDMMNFFGNFPKHSHPMAILASMVASLSAFYPEIEDSDPEENIDLTVTRLLSKMRTIAAFTYRQQDGQQLVNPSYKYSYCENFLNMLFYSPVKEYIINPVYVKALNKLLIL
ncbi:MAG: citrate/2-methylcitrate synthase, partial [Sphaerochaetaceae bacterium]|nr:citrate/2-methylcitrate synthase [Sphaerochaetaceae bacterium]